MRVREEEKMLIPEERQHKKATEQDCRNTRYYMTPAASASYTTKESLQLLNVQDSPNFSSIAISKIIIPKQKGKVLP